jgi:hypothetical protein
MQTRPDLPPETAAPPPQEAEAGDRVARILARYGGEQPLDPDRRPALAQEIAAALVELAGAEEPAPPDRPPPRSRADEPMVGVDWWRRLVLAAVAVTLIALFWHRLAWFG